MSLNRTSLDTEVLILRRMYAMSTANIPVSTNYILGIGTAGQAYFQNTLQNISTYGIDLSSTISTLYGQIANINISGGVTYPYFISTISGLLVYINTQDASIVSTFSSQIVQINSTISGLNISNLVTQTQLTSTISGVYDYISTVSTSQGDTISTNYTTLSGQISSINGYNSTYSTNIGATISSLDGRISTNTTNISTVNNYLDLRISSLSAAQISSYISLSTMIEQAVVSSAFDQLSSFSTQINNSLISTSNSFSTQISAISSNISTLQDFVIFNAYDIEQLSTLVSTNYVSTNIFIQSTGQGVYNNPYFQTNTTISGSLSMITGGEIDASGSSTFTRTLHVGALSTDLSAVILQVNNNYGKQFGTTNTSQSIIYNLTEYPSTNKGTLALYDINNNSPSTNTGSSIIFGGLYTDDKLWYRAKISAVAPPTADASGIYGAGDIVFTTKDNNNTLLMTDKMRIMHNGNVIIGPQLSTTQKLYVHGSATFESTIFTSTASATSIVANNIQTGTASATSIVANTIQTNTISCTTINGSPTVNGVLTIQNGGTSINPSIIFGTPLDSGGFLDDNTGIYHPAANSIAISCNGFPHIICSTNVTILNVNTYNALSATIAGNLTICGSIIANTLNIDAISSNTIVNNSTITYTRSGIQYPLAPSIFTIRPAVSMPKSLTPVFLSGLAYTIPLNGYYQYTLQIVITSGLSTPVYGDTIATAFEISGFLVNLPGTYHVSPVVQTTTLFGGANSYITITGNIGRYLTSGQIIVPKHVETGTFTYTATNISAIYTFMGE